MTEAVRQICAAAFLELDIIRITGLVYAPNVASQRALEKNSFIREGKGRICAASIGGQHYKSPRICDITINKSIERKQK